jgi:hypothetical protein
MWTCTKWIGTAALAALTVLGAAPPRAEAQVNPLFQVPFGVNPYAFKRPGQLGFTPLQYAYQTQVMGQALSNVPPYALGYNPYNPIAYGGGYGGGYNPYTSPYAGYANPYSPVAPAYGGSSLANPYTPTGAGYDSAAYNPYIPYADPASQYLRAQSSMMLDQERARILREQAIQAKLETKKKILETELWIKANTPTYTEEQAKIAKTVLKRIQTNASPAEIVAGTALNVLLKDLSKHPGQKAAVGALPVDEEVLRHLNITASGVGDLGLLRNEGRFTWPTALRDLAPAAEQKEMEVQAQAVVSQAANGKVDNNLLAELKTNVGKLRTQLIAKGNDIPTAQYIDGRRFLNNFEDALLALEKGDAVEYFNFQKFISGGKSVQAVASYMIDRGLRFAPAVLNGDDAAYQAMLTALAAYDVAISAQDVAVNKE